MAEPKTTDDDVDVIMAGDSSSKVTSSCKKFGDRQLFTVELRPDETTTVSWKKLLRDANKLTKGSNSEADTDNLVTTNAIAIAAAHPNLDSRIAPPADKEKKDDQPHRFSAVIEKIERLYMGKDSDDEELDDTPDDDQYDTEDSFIDDADLDEYFEVDNSAIKHDGFFINRGTLERIEPVIVPEQQQKKRKRKDIPKVDDDGSKKNKQAKPGKAAVEKSVPQPEKNSFGPSTNVAVSRENLENHRSQNQLNAGDSTKKKAAVSKTADRSSSLKISNGGASVSLPDPNVIEKPKAEVLASKNVTDKSKDGSSNISHQKFHKKSVLPSKFQHAKATSNIDEGQMKQNNDIRKLPNSKSSMQTIKPSHLPKKDGSSGRPKVSFLEKAIVELKEVVVERTPVTENPDADNTSSLTTKRRMPREVKLKLAKVARAEHAISGKITEELVRRLNGILGHFIQLRSLKE